MEERKQLQKTDKIAPALKMVVMCLPPVLMSLIGLALSRRKGGREMAAGKPAAPAASVRRSSG